MEINTNAVAKREEVKDVDALLNDKLSKTEDVKTAIDILATKTALEKTGVVEKVVEEKAEELRNDAEAKRLIAEQERILQERNKELAEKERQIAEFDRIISQKEKEVEAMKKDSDKAQAFFDANREILKCIGIRNKKSLRAMQVLMYPASILFAIVQILMLPLTLCGIIIERVVAIAGSICGEIKNNAWKIVLSIFVILLVVAVLVLAYVYGGKLLAGL